MKRVRKSLTENRKRLTESLYSDYYDIVRAIAGNVRSADKDGYEDLEELVYDEIRDYLVYYADGWTVYAQNMDTSPFELNDWWEAEDELFADIKDELGEDFFEIDEDEEEGEDDYEESYRKIRRPSRIKTERFNRKRIRR